MIFLALASLGPANARELTLSFRTLLFGEGISCNEEACKQGGDWLVCKSFENLPRKEFLDSELMVVNPVSTFVSASNF